MRLKEGDVHSRPNSVIIATFAGLVAGLGAWGVRVVVSPNAGDFGPARTLAQALIDGKDPYSHPVDSNWVPYPLPAALIALPSLILPDTVSGGVFFGASSALLALGIARHDAAWRMPGMFLSWPFVYSMMFVQWPPLTTAVWFFPWLTPLVLCKPQGVLAILMTRLPGWRPIALTAAILLISLAIVPTWPITWLNQIRQFQGTTPPVLYWPLGPAILLAALRWRDRRARLVALLSLMPQRMFYDQLPLLLVARSPRQMAFLTVCSWISFVVLWSTPGGMPNMLGGWQTWVLVAHYAPALAVLFLPESKTAVD